MKWRYHHLPWVWFSDEELLFPEDEPSHLSLDNFPRISRCLISAPSLSAQTFSADDKNLHLILSAKMQIRKCRQTNSSNSEHHCWAAWITQLYMLRGAHEHPPANTWFLRPASVIIQNSIGELSMSMNWSKMTADMSRHWRPIIVGCKCRPSVLDCVSRPLMPNSHRPTWLDSTI